MKEGRIMNEYIGKQYRNKDGFLFYVVSSNRSETVIEEVCTKKTLKIIGFRVDGTIINWDKTVDIIYS
jgi:hypothetical protein